MLNGNSSSVIPGVCRSRHVVLLCRTAQAILRRRIVIRGYVSSELESYGI